MTDAEAPILWPPDVESQLIGKDPDSGKNWKQKKKSLACCSSWDRKESDTT